MRRTVLGRAIWLMALLVCGWARLSEAAPVSRNEAFGAASALLPSFFPGDWFLADEITLHLLSGEAGAFLFVFESGGKTSDDQARNSPQEFVARTRADLAGQSGRPTGYEPELRGEDRYATIMISAEDTAPPVLRCFRGLPFQRVREVNALDLAGREKDGKPWRVRHHLMLGFFDEAFLVEPVDGGGDAMVVDLRTHAVVTEPDAQAQARLQSPRQPDPDLARMSQEAWAPYRTESKTIGGAQ